MARVGVDVGGTNTDLVLEADHGVFVHKVASTPHDQSEGVLKGLRELCDISGVRPDDVSLIVHGTTIATNITVEHNGAEVGMLTSRRPWSKDAPRTARRAPGRKACPSHTAHTGSAGHYSER